MRALVLCVLAACYSPSPAPGAPCNTNGDCPSGLECSPQNTCEKPGSAFDAPIEPDACTTGACSGDTLIGCGTNPIACANGCTAAGAPHCKQLAPSNGLTTALLSGATADIDLDKLNFDATDGSIRMMNTDIRVGGTGVISGIRFQVINNVGVWVANSWKLSAGNTWSFAGRASALYANTTIRIESTIDMSANLAAAGPGGAGANASTVIGGCSGKAGRGLDATHAEGGGGGGGGNATMGGNGGPSNMGGTLTGVGGSCATRPSTIPLTGGAGGGHGGAAATSSGGAGGGAIALVAMDSVTITGAATIHANGGGGAAASGNAGGGGGGGGAILVESPTVTIQGKLFANGGGGGAPGGGTAGANGPLSATAAAGGTYAGNGGPAAGGAGGFSITNGRNGTTYNFDDTVAVPPVNYNRGGGGGGGFGKIEVKRRTGGVAGTASPAATISDAVFE